MGDLADNSPLASTAALVAHFSDLAYYDFHRDRAGPEGVSRVSVNEGKRGKPKGSHRVRGLRGSQLEGET